MKLYLHYEGSPPCTAVYSMTDPSTTVDQMLSWFVEKYNSMNSHALLDKACVEAHSGSRRRELERTVVVRKSVKNLADIYVIATEQHSVPELMKPAAGEEVDRSESCVELLSLRHLMSPMASGQGHFYLSVLSPTRRYPGRGGIPPYSSCTAIPSGHQRNPASGVAD